jgi:hypothetical protein
MKNRSAVMTCLCIAVALLSLAARPQTSKSFSFATYKERIDRVTILVGSFPAALNAEEAYIPIPVAVGIREKGPGMTISSESFNLIDSEGHAYPVASYEEILAQTELHQRNTTLLASQPLVTGQQFANSRRISSNFFPLTGLKYDHVNLERGNHFIDTLYFPRPQSGLGAVLILRFQDPALEEPIEVRFEVPLKGKRQAEKKTRQR